MYYEYDKDMIFVYFEQAYDSVSRQQFMNSDKECLYTEKPGQNIRDTQLEHPLKIPLSRGAI